jgi:hypothetical protein
MAYTHLFTQRVVTPEGTLEDSAATTTGDTTTSVATTVDANGGSANAVAIAFTAAGLQSLVLLSTVPCVVTLTGATVIDGITIGTVTLAANTMRRVTAITGNVTAISVGANTTSSGAAGTITIAALFNS